MAATHVEEAGHALIVTDEDGDELRVQINEDGRTVVTTITDNRNHLASVILDVEARRDLAAWLSAPDKVHDASSIESDPMAAQRHGH